MPEITPPKIRRRRAGLDRTTERLKFLALAAELEAAEHNFSYTDWLSMSTLVSKEEPPLSPPKDKPVAHPVASSASGRRFRED